MISGIESTNYIWKYRTAITAGTIATPYVVEGGYFFYKFFRNFEGVKKKIQEAVHFWIHSFKPIADESSPDFIKRLLKNVSISLLLMGSVGLAAGSAFYMLPSFLVIPIAIATIAGVGDLLLNAPHYSAKITQGANSTKKFLKDSFTRRQGESELSGTLRIFRNAVLALGGTLVALTALGLTVHYTGVLIATTAHGDMWHPLEITSSLLIFMFYGGLGVLHGLIGIKNWRDGDKKAAIFHFMCMIMGFVFPTLYYLNSPVDPMRLHHSILGLLFALVPLWPFQFLGSLIMMDSFCNIFFYQYGKSYGEFDFMNLIFPDHIPEFVANFIASSSLGHLSNAVLKNSQT